jgi:hypothetical protein
MEKTKGAEALNEVANQLWTYIGIGAVVIIAVITIIWIIRRNLRI